MLSIFPDESISHKSFSLMALPESSCSIHTPSSIEYSLGRISVSEWEEIVPDLGIFSTQALTAYAFLTKANLGAFGSIALVL